MGQFRVAFPTNHYDAAVAFYRDHFDTETMSEWDQPARGVVLRLAGDGCIELFDAGPGTGAAPQGLLLSIEQPSPRAVDDLYAIMSADAPVVEPLGNAPWGHRTFRVTDPSGITLAFWAPLTEDL